MNKLHIAILFSILVCFKLSSQTITPTKVSDTDLNSVKEIKESYEWIKKFMEIHSVNGNPIKITINLGEIRESKQDGYALIGFKDIFKESEVLVSEKFIILLNEIVSVSFTQNPDYPIATNLTLEADESGTGIVYYDKDFSKLYQTNIYDIPLLLNENDKVRLMNGMQNILENNKKFIFETQKH